MRTLPPRHGMTNSQMLTVIVSVCAFGLVGLVLLVGGALFFPAISGTREAARRSQCKNNLKQLGLALHNYHDVYGSFPPGYVYREQQNNYGWSASILPFLEQQFLYERMNFHGEWDPVLASQVLPVFLCPNDPHPPIGIGGLARSNYPGSHGSEELRDDVETASGVFFRNSSVKIMKITDGSSNTLMVGERSRTENGYPAHSGLWIGYRQGTGPVDLLFRAPKDPGDTNVLINAGDGSGISSNHTGGTHALFCDGAVRFLNETLDPKLLRELSTRAASDSSTTCEF